MQVRKAARFVAINGSFANHEKNSVDLLFDGADGQSYAIELDPDVIPATITAATGHLNELAATRADLQSQPMDARGMSVAMSSDGSVGLQLTLASDLKLNLFVPKEQAPALLSVLDELRELLTRDVQ